MNQQLKDLYESDREDHAVQRIVGDTGYAEMRSRDSERREKVRAILDSDEPNDPIDLYHAAWVLNHGDQIADAELAYHLAERSYTSGYDLARWLYAAAFDRWCMYSGLPQKFGTQIVPDGVCYRVWDTNPVTTDGERKQFNVPSIETMRERAREESRTMAQPPMEHAPDWLVDAIKRWNSS